MRFVSKIAGGCFALLLTIPAGQAFGQAPATGAATRAAATVRVTGTVRDQTNGISLPGVPVEVVGSTQVVYTDVDGGIS
jgi:hypothetical protein